MCCGKVCGSSNSGYNPRDYPPLSKKAVDEGMEKLKGMKPDDSGQKAGEIVGCGGETVEQHAEEIGAAFLKKAQALRGERPIVYGRDCKGALTFAAISPKPTVKSIA